jgi:hypothetical protein
VSYCPRRESNDEVVAAKRLTMRDLAAAWGVALAVFAGVAAISAADLVGLTDSKPAALHAAAAPSREAAPPC